MNRHTSHDINTTKSLVLIKITQTSNIKFLVKNIKFLIVAVIYYLKKF